jgi:hypothetical protein
LTAAFSVFSTIDKTNEIGMQNYLQAILTRVVVSFLLIMGATISTYAQELYEEADQLFERRGYFEASSDYVAAYSK